jgi:hypothetical protein
LKKYGDSYSLTLPQDDDDDDDDIIIIIIIIPVADDTCLH